jgi:hypothetical protein
MKTLFLIFSCILSWEFASSQLKVSAVCPPFAVDVLAGNVNKIHPKSTLGEIQKTFPCYTEIVQGDSSSKCIGIFYRDKGVNFYTDRNYIEIGENFKGKLEPALIGVNRSNLFGLLGYPKIKDINWDAFQMEYGTLVLYYNKAGKINKIQISSKSTETLKLCE